jgi:hypothetical protein
MPTTSIEIGDRVKTKQTLKDGKALLLPKGSVGRVYDRLGETKEGPEFVVAFEGHPCKFNFWQDELQLVKKGKPGDRKKPPPEPTKHPQKAINLGGRKVEVDVKLARLIQGLYRAGILTCMSCQEDSPGVTWLMFPRIEYAQVFVLKASKALESFTWKNDGFLVDPDDAFGAVSIRFPLADLKAVTRLFAGKNSGE